MKYFITLVLLPAAALAMTMPLSNMAAYKVAAEPRDSFASNVWDESAFATSYAAPAPAPSGLGFGGNFDIGLPGFFNTALAIVLALIALTMMTQLVAKVTNIPVLSEMLADGSRSLSPETLNQLGTFAEEAIKKFQEIYEDI